MFTYNQRQQVIDSNGFGYTLPMKLLGMHMPQIDSYSVFTHDSQSQSFNISAYSVDQRSMYKNVKHLSSNMSDDTIVTTVSGYRHTSETLLEYYRNTFCFCPTFPEVVKRVSMDTPASAPVKRPNFVPLNTDNLVIAKSVVLKPAPLKMQKKESFHSVSTPLVLEELDDCENMDKKVESIINSTYPENPLANGSLKPVSKRKLFHLRQDVITKTIFRALRKHYLKDFRAYFDFTKETNLNHQGEDERLLRKASSYLTKTIGESSLKLNKVYLLSLLDTKRRFIRLNAINEAIREKLAGLLYTFNKNKMEELMTIPEFCSLVLYFLNQEGVINTVVKVRSDTVTLKTYQDQIEKLKKQCMQTMNQ